MPHHICGMLSVKSKDAELLAALKNLGLDQHRPVALIMTKNSDQSTEIL